MRRAERDAKQHWHAGEGVRRQMSIAEGDVSRAAGRGWAQLHEETRRWAAACQVRRICAARRIQVGRAPEACSRGVQRRFQRFQIYRPYFSAPGRGRNENSDGTLLGAPPHREPCGSRRFYHVPSRVS